MKTVILCATITSMLIAAASAQNADITWQIPLTISGTSDVNTSGTLAGTWAPGDDAYNPDILPVNGVAFNAYGSGPFNALVGISGNDDHYTGYGNPGTADSNYNTILQAALYSYGEAMTITWGGMTSGDTYLLEFWVNDGRDIGEARSETLTGGANTSAALSFGSDGNGPGQYIIGEFVADSTGTETLTLNPFSSGANPSAQINLLQLRDLTVVPEPSALALLAAGASAMLFGFRRKNREI